MKITSKRSVFFGLGSVLAVGVLGVWMPTGLAQETVAPKARWQQSLDFLKQEDKGPSQLRMTQALNDRLAAILNFFKQEHNDPGRNSPGISRGPVCAISLSREVVIWNTRPLLAWQGRSFPTIGIREISQTAPLWSETAADTEADILQLPYAGMPLEPGSQYEWLFYFGTVSNPGSPSLWVQFQVLEGEDRDRISAGLSELQAQLEAEGADEETIALARAEYFLENDLPSDALQAVFAVGEPSEALLETRAALVEEICAIE